MLCIPSIQVVVCSRSKVDWKVFLSLVFFSPETYRGRCDKEKGSQVEDCWVFSANNLNIQFYFSHVSSHSLSVSYYLSLIFSLSISAVLSHTQIQYIDSRDPICSSGWILTRSTQDARSSIKENIWWGTHQYKSLVQRHSLNINGNWSELPEFNYRNAVTGAQMDK